MPKVSEAHLETRKQQIVDAAFACFARQGFHQTTIQDICREAGVSPGAVYRYFASKEEIIEACCDQCRQTGMAALEASSHMDDTLEILDQLAATAFGELDQPDTYPVLSVKVQWWSEALRSPELRESLLRNDTEFWESALGQVISKAQGQGEINPDLNPAAAARVLLSMWQGFVLQKALDPGLDLASYLDAVRAMYSGSFWIGRTRT